MSHPIQSFFRKYNAVSATDAGPQWDSASEETLVEWSNNYCRTCREQPGARKRIAPEMRKLRDEIARRSNRYEQRTPERMRLNGAKFQLELCLGEV